MKTLAGALALIACNASFAADAPDPERLGEARAMLDAMHIEHQLETGSKMMAESMAKSFTAGAGPIVNQRVLQVMMEEGMSSAKEAAMAPGGIIDQMATFYATEFSVEELRQIKTYYQSAAAQHMLQAQPKMMQQALPGMIAAMRARLPAVCEKAKTRLIAEKVENADKMPCPAPQ